MYGLLVILFLFFCELFLIAKIYVFKDCLTGYSKRKNKISTNKNDCLKLSCIISSHAG